MANKRRQSDLQFKKDAVRYVELHPDISHERCAINLNIGRSTLSRWSKEASENEGEATFTGSGNYGDGLEKENARLRRELKNTQDTLDILKKPSAFWATD